MMLLLCLLFTPGLRGQESGETTGYAYEAPSASRAKGAGYAHPQADPLHLPFSRRFIHRIGAEVRPGYIAPTHAFFRGDNYLGVPLEETRAGHLKYSFQFRENTYKDRISGSAYQGVGIAYNTFFDKDELGNPYGFYLFQGARIARFASRLSLHYEWNFGLTFGWRPYNWENNQMNTVIGSKVNAYINADFYFNYLLSKRIDLLAGVALAHYSNGSTKIPNAGLNTIGMTFGLVYNFNRDYDRLLRKTPLPGPAFKRHMSYDLVLFGSWRSRGVVSGGDFQTSRHTVLGFSFASMYNVGYKLRVGAGLDAVYDGSANIYQDGSSEYEKPWVREQMALGLSARIDYVMPYFTVTIGMGGNVLHGGGELKSYYQLLALKIDVGRNSFVHIGYSLKQFKAPNYLMLGVGYRFNNIPQTYRP